MKPNKIIGRNIRRLRDYSAYSQDDVARFLGVSRAYISFVESGEIEPIMEHLEKITDLFNVQLIDLLQDNTDLQEVNCAFAFPKNGTSSIDFNSVAGFQKVVKSYLKMKHIANEDKNI